MKNTPKKILRRFVTLALALVVCTSTVLMPSTGAVTQADIDALKNQASSLTGEKAELKSKLSSLQDSQDTIMEKKKLLDDQYALTQKEIDNVNAQIANYNNLITEKETKIAETQAKEEKQYELFCTRVRAMEENGTVSYWEVIFKATDFSDLLSRLDFITEIMEYDENLIQQLRDLRQQINEQKTELEGAKTEVVSAKSELVTKRQELAAQAAQANSLMNDLESQADEYEATLKKLEAEEDSIQAKIVAKSKELAAQANSGKPTGTVSTNTWTGSGGYIWPETASKRITSPFGTRMHPIYHRYITHNGVDIGGVGTSTSILAAKAGTVIVSAYSSSYGNYVVISHGSGNTTLYAHMSALKVNEGDYVKQGTVVGISGSTGNSTGPHLHFEITEGGSRVNPLNYLTGYVSAW